MRLTKNSKAVLLGNIELLKFINEHALDMDKIKQCNIESLGDNCYAFCMSKKNAPKSKCPWFPMDVDLATQPDIVLLMNVDDRVISIESTDKTRELLSLSATNPRTK